jgi:hypothetical protein
VKSKSARAAGVAERASIGLSVAKLNPNTADFLEYFFQVCG